MLAQIYDVISMWKRPLLMISLWPSVAWSWRDLGNYGNMIILL